VFQVVAGQALYEGTTSSRAATEVQDNGFIAAGGQGLKPAGIKTPTARLKAVPCYRPIFGTRFRCTGSVQAFRREAFAGIEENGLIRIKFLPTRALAAEEAVI
jgi:hypothetical protein